MVWSEVRGPKVGGWTERWEEWEGGYLFDEQVAIVGVDLEETCRRDLRQFHYPRERDLSFAPAYTPQKT